MLHLNGQLVDAAAISRFCKPTIGHVLKMHVMR